MLRCGEGNDDAVSLSTSAPVLQLGPTSLLLLWLAAIVPASNTLVCACITLSKRSTAVAICYHHRYCYCLCAVIIRTAPSLPLLAALTGCFNHNWPRALLQPINVHCLQMARLMSGLVDDDDVFIASILLPPVSVGSCSGSSRRSGLIFSFVFVCCF